MTAATKTKSPATSLGAGGNRTGRFAGLDGLRAIAVIAVMLYHLSPGALPGGYLGVDIFFVISGFLITSLLSREQAGAGRIRLVNFWVRRARRLLPALAIVLLGCCTAAAVIGGDVLVNLKSQLLGAVTFSSNWLAIAGNRSYFDETTPELFRNLWSLAVEEQFYLLWPLIILAITLIRSRIVRLSIVAALAVASAVAMALLFVPGDATRVYYGTDTHSFGIAIGASLAILWFDWPALQSVARRGYQLVGVIAVCGLLAASVLMTADAASTYQGGLLVVSVLTAVAISAAIAPGSRLGAVLDNKLLRWVGERSYGLYLWHWPVFVLVISALPSWAHSGASGWAIGGIALAITTVAAAVSYHFIEQPVRENGFRATIRGAVSWRSGGGWRRAGMVSLGTILVIGTAGTAVGVASDNRVGVAQAKIEQGQDAIIEQRLGTSKPDAPQPLPGGDQISAIGDSVMLASAPELQAAFPGIEIDAVVSRQLSGAVRIVESMLQTGTLRSTVVIGLGTNGPIDTKILRELRGLVGTDHQIVLVNVFAPRWWTDGVNSSLSQFAQQYRDVELANWRDAIAGRVRLLAGDQIHPGTEGGRVYVGAVRDALQRLSELPPVLGPRDYGLAPLPS